MFTSNYGLEIPYNVKSCKDYPLTARSGPVHVSAHFWALTWNSGY